ncbi:sigma-54 dependent transcriptional regulator [Vreelandella arcis]|uniref:DNA-binding transcriptional response regulator, NtrC family, contains REC, AAA-type ATPase, and a Fis-type DNA-binding domains n=1 Tax=Vreelandella arcis TaxID=416873 RepID=A0A1H0J5C1_9GAMM|nr:sigma-54 dependent transcriptional regulator [Halomonas arcis]SDO38948.1 DNA-binding transcriptional response regulator, NtrC family, contains REC, AAA-type ATPase, and a Fis-type DNA-binding domains [Halomonas arcis]
MNTHKKFINVEDEPITTRPRKVLVLGCDTLGYDVDEALGNAQWHIKYAHNQQEASTIIGNGDEYFTSIYILKNTDSQLLDDLQELIVMHPEVAWLAVVDPLSIQVERIRRFVHQYFFAFLTLPLDPIKTQHLLEAAREMTLLSALSPSKFRNEYRNQDMGMVGNSPVMQRLYQSIYRIAQVDAPVLITGESGTGKELVARAIHEQSPRRHGPFNAINCGALPPGLIQSELFGHEKGAFTGAGQRKFGIIESTSGGTLFLDEIGDLPLDMQVNLLRFLENHHVFRLGSLKETKVDVRVLAASHVNLEEAIKLDKFREDLYHRLNVLQLTPPPLRERSEDIEEIANFFFKKYRTEKASKVKGFSRESLLLMRQYAWPGNIRELINRIRRAMVMCDQRLIRPEDLGLERRQRSSRSQVTLEQARDLAEESAIRASLARNKYQVQHSACELDVSRATLYRLIEKHGIDRQLEKNAQ